eukprot:5633360-Pleurochrysis_carterae.AAC.2
MILDDTPQHGHSPGPYLPTCITSISTRLAMSDARLASSTSGEPAPHSLSVARLTFAFDHSRTGSFPVRGF